MSVAHDPCRIEYREPAGAVPTGTPVTLKLRVDEFAKPWFSEVRLLVGEPGGSIESLEWRAVPLEEERGGYRAHMQASDGPRVAFYAFELVLTGGESFFYVPRADGRSTMGELVVSGVDGTWGDDGWSYADHRIEKPSSGQYGLEGPKPGFQLTVYESGFTTPEWLSGAIMYQIFPDRFARGRRGALEKGLAAHESMGRPVRLHSDWNEEPEWEGTFGDGGEDDPVYDPIDFFGGTLAGIREKLPYLASLGVEVLYLNPVFEARSNHRYDTADYERIDPLLGTNGDFRKLASAARKQGISILLDAVLSHTGDDSRYFNALGTYDEPGAIQGSDSPYFAWYDFEHPSEGASYRCWWGYPALPEVDERNGSWQRYMFGGAHGPRGVLAQWLDRGAGGFRLDVADEIPDEVLEELRESVKSAKPDAAIIGEVWEDPTTKVSYGSRRTYALGGSLDSVMNYPLRAALLGFALQSVDAYQLCTFLKLQQSNYPSAFYRCAMNLLSSHDVERVRSVLAFGQSLKQFDRFGQYEAVSAITAEQDEAGAQLQRMLVGLLYALPGSPCIYYGDERGMHGGGDPFCRATFPWDGARRDCGVDVTDAYRELGAIRKGSDALREGPFACYALGPDALAVVRTAGESEDGASWVVLVNRSDRAVSGAFDAACILTARAPREWKPAHECDGGRVTSESGIVLYTAPPRRAVYFSSSAGAC